MGEKRPKVICVIGNRKQGMSLLALELAKRLEEETGEKVKVVSADALSFPEEYHLLTRDEVMKDLRELAACPPAPGRSAFRSYDRVDAAKMKSHWSSMQQNMNRRRK